MLWINIIQRSVYDPSSKIYSNPPYIWAEWTCLMLKSANFDLLSNVLKVKIYPE